MEDGNEVKQLEASRSIILSVLYQTLSERTEIMKAQQHLSCPKINCIYPLLHTGYRNRLI